MPRIARALLPATAIALGWLGASPAASQEATLGGGSDIAAGTVVEVAPGTAIPPVHHVFADNSESRPIEVEFRAEAPPGIEITPEGTAFTIRPGESVRNPFAIRVGDAVAPGDHQVTVQLVRSDITAHPGEVTNIPAVGTTFTLRVVGDAATITVEARSEQSGEPVNGTLTLAAVTGPNATFEVARTDGAELTARVAPGEYRAAYLLAGRELASAEVEVAAAESERVSLEVRSVSFLAAFAEPIEEDGKVVVGELVASVENHLQPIDGLVVIQALVHRDGNQIDTVVLDELNGLPLGVTEAELTYRPADGFADGAYRFVFELVTGEFTLQAPTDQTFEVGSRSSADAIPPIAIAIAAAAGTAVVAAGGWTISRRIRRRRLRQ